MCVHVMFEKGHRLSQIHNLCVALNCWGFYRYIMMIFIYCGRGERMRICHNLNRSNSTPVPLNAHLWLAAFYCPPSGAAVWVCRRISQPRGWPLILLLQAVASLPSFLSNIYWKHVLRNLWACDANECMAQSRAGHQMQRDGHVS